MLSTFLSGCGHQSIPLRVKADGLRPVSLFLGPGKMGLEIPVWEAVSDPTDILLRQAWGRRKKARPAPVLAAVEYPVSGGFGIALCGPTGENPTICKFRDRSHAEQLCDAALRLPDPESAIRFIARGRQSFKSGLPGINNYGLFAEHVLVSSASGGEFGLEDWKSAWQNGKEAMELENHELLKKLGYDVMSHDNITSILVYKKKHVAVAILLRSDEQPEAASHRFNDWSPITYALGVAGELKLEWVVIVRQSELRLYAAENKGVGRRGRTESYLECITPLLNDEAASILWHAFSATALTRDGTANRLLAASRRFAGNLAVQLRERIYKQAVPILALGISKERDIPEPSHEDLKLTYEMALTVLFRLLFIAFAEDRDLLPYSDNEHYKARSLKDRAITLAELANGNGNPGNGSNYWDEIAQLWKAVGKGNETLGIPQYNGNLFSDDAADSEAGAELSKISLPNSLYADVLQNVLLVKPDDGKYAPVDFRTLSVREFGTIYEGLISSELSCARSDLTVDKDGVFLPAGKGDVVEVAQGAVFLHNQTGARKTSGSYYTPEIAVEHMLDKALEPALDKHFNRIKLLDAKDQAEQLFDFRVADIAMGSGHFLIAAIDRLERRYSQWLAKHELPGVRIELDKLRQAATTQLKNCATNYDIEDSQLLRRLIARRCIYGVDINPLAVMLARLSVWVHTFVPGLPLSLLDRNLIVGNALVGIGTVNEIEERLKNVLQESSLFLEEYMQAIIKDSASIVTRMAKMSDATIRDIQIGRSLMEKFSELTVGTRVLCDMLVARPLAKKSSKLGKYLFASWTKDLARMDSDPAYLEAQQLLAAHNPLHFPLAFPEVFQRGSKYFDVLIGNPPWKGIGVKQDKFWARYEPGLCGKKPPEQKLDMARLRRQRPDLVGVFEQEKSDAKALRDIIKAAHYAKKCAGGADLYKAFCGRFLQFSESGNIGVVLPRNALINDKSDEFRREFFVNDIRVDLAVLRNTAHWVFPDVHASYEIALASRLISTACPPPPDVDVSLSGPYLSSNDLSVADKERDVAFPSYKINDWGRCPLFPTQKPAVKSLEIFEQMNRLPRLGSAETKNCLLWRARSGTDINQTMQSGFVKNTSGNTSGAWPVYRGKSFDIWEPGKYEDRSLYGWAKPKPVLQSLQTRRMKAHGKRNSIYSEFPHEHITDASTLPPLHNRLAYRDVARSTDQRTVICCLVPANVFLVDSAPFLLFPLGSESDMTFVLGMLCSRCVDWYARTIVGAHVNPFIMHALPIPRSSSNCVLRKRIIAIAGRLACSDDRFTDWAQAIKVGCGFLEDSAKFDLNCELDAVAALLCGLSKKQFEHILRTFHIGWDYDDHLLSSLEYFDSWTRQLRGGSRSKM